MIMTSMCMCCDTFILIHCIIDLSKFRNVGILFQKENKTPFKTHNHELGGKRMGY